MITIDIINKNIAKKLGMSYSEVEAINRSQYDHLANIIKDSTTDFKFMYIGKIVRKKGKPKRYGTNKRDT